MFRRSMALIGSVVVLLALAGPASARPASILVVEQVRMPSHAAPSTSAVGIAPPPCQDGAFRTLGAWQHATWKWSFKAATRPTGLKKPPVAANRRPVLRQARH